MLTNKATSLEIKNLLTFANSIYFKMSLRYNHFFAIYFMNKIELLEQAAKNSGFHSLSQLINHKSKPSRIVELMKNPEFNPHQSIETSLLFTVLSDDMKAQINKMPTEELKVACAAYLADDLPEVVALIS
ncbi:MAG: hypothetical protein I8H71_04480 [Xanthomonadaceae bacterium]|nr:hypothetical protein [Xanthomonadaceae bacterium]